MQKLLTIVVPVYKVEQYINKCLDSCIIYKADGSLDEEMMNQLEVIIVNDGTPDNSAELSRVYTKRYPQTFRQIDKENGGHGSAWNVGLKEATGKYLRFLDSDDWLTNLDKLMEKLQDCDADLVFTDYNKYYTDTNSYELQTIHSDINSIFVLNDTFFSHQQSSVFVMNFWHTNYKTSILQAQYPLFAEGVMYDDSILAIAPLLYAKTGIYWNFPLYNYLLGRPGQTMNEQVRAKNVNSYIKCYHHQVDWLNKHKSVIPIAFLQDIQNSIIHYAQIVFGTAIYMPLMQAKAIMDTYYKEGYLNHQHNSQMAKRYEKMPFGVFYIQERLRLKCKKILGK